MSEKMIAQLPLLDRKFVVKSIDDESSEIAAVFHWNASAQLQCTYVPKSELEMRISNRLVQIIDLGPVPAQA